MAASIQLPGMSKPDSETAAPALRKKPKLRGVSHEVAAYLSVLSGGILLLLSRQHVLQNPEDRAIFWGNALYALCLTLLFGISAFYHRPQWSPKIRTFLRRVDHSAIYLLIAGTGTAVGMAAFQDADGFWGAVGYLTLLWVGSVLGILKSIFWIHAPKPVTALAYILMGLSALPFLPRLAHGLGFGSIALICIGGGLYILGALAYAVRRPDPWPEVFGYHEVFHLFVIAGAACHYGAILRVVT